VIIVKTLVYDSLGSNIYGKIYMITVSG